MPSFLVERYTVKAANVTKQRFVLVRLSSYVSETGLITQAELYYLPSYHKMAGWVHDAGVMSDEGITITAGLPFQDFDRHHRLLRTVSPIAFDYHFRESATGSKQLTLIAIGSGPEIQGERLERIPAPD